MSITVSIPDAIADEIYWYLLENIESGGRASNEAWTWLQENYLPKLRPAWKRLKKKGLLKPEEARREV